MPGSRYPFAFKHRIVTIYALTSGILFVFLKWIDSGFIRSVVDFFFAFYPFLLIFTVSLVSFFKYRSYQKIAIELPHVEGVLQKMRLETLQTIASLLVISFLFYLLYSPESYLPVFSVLSEAFFRFSSFDILFLVLSGGMTLLLSGALLYAVSRYFHDRGTDRFASFPAFRKKLFQAAFFAVFSLFVLSLAAFAEAYHPMTEYLASSMASFIGREPASDITLQAAVADSVRNLRGSLAETNDSLRSDLGRTKGDLDRAIADSGLDVSGQLSDEIKTRLSSSGGTVSGGLVIRSGLSVKDASFFEDLLPQDSGTYDLGATDTRWKTLYSESADFSGTVTGLLSPTGTLDMGGFVIRNIGTLGTAFTEAGGLELSGALSTGSPIAPRYGGTGLDTSASSGVPIVSSGTWTVHSVLPVSMGGTGVSISLTRGGVLFVGAGGILAQDNANFFYDEATHRLSLGAGASPLARLHINGGTGSLSTGLAFGDGDTGFYESSDDVLRLQTAGVDRVTVLANGNVGIGTTSPTNKLEVLGGDIAISYGRGLKTLNGTYKNILTSGYNGVNDFVSLYTPGDSIGDATPKITMLDNGNVGINTTTPAQKLDIASGNIKIDNTTGATPYGVIYKGSDRFIHDFNYGLNGGGITTAGQNTFIGINAGNFSMGADATQTYHASYNTGIGQNALISNTTGYYNSAIGLNALRSNTTGASNAAIGVYALINNTTGYNNSAIGVYAGRYLADGSVNETSNNSLFLGYDTRASVAGGSNEIVIGASAIGLGSNTVVLGNSSITTTALRGNVGVGVETMSARLHIRGAGTTSSTLGLLVENSSGVAGFTVRDDGNVGIGTTTPNQKLSIAGTLGIQGGSYYTVFQGGTQAANLTYTLPTALASAGQQLTDVNGDGILSWSAAGSLRSMKNIDQQITDPTMALDQLLATNIYTHNTMKPNYLCYTETDGKAQTQTKERIALVREIIEKIR